MTKRVEKINKGNVLVPEDKRIIAIIDKTIYIHFTCLSFLHRRICEEKNIITVGRLTSDKGVLDIINMYYQVQLELPDVTLDIVGDGPELNKIKKKIFDLRINEKIYFDYYFIIYNICM